MNADTLKIKSVLTELKCPEVLTKFVEQKVDWEAFLLLDRDLLLRMGIPIGSLQEKEEKKTERN